MKNTEKTMDKIVALQKPGLRVPGSEIYGGLAAQHLGLRPLLAQS